MPRKTDLKNDPDYIELMNFLIERTRDAKSPLNIDQLAREFKEKNGSPRNFSLFSNRIRRLRGKIVESDTIDETTKVNMVFALSAPIDTRYLEELQKVADVEIDGNNRITKYSAKYGSFVLEGEHNAFSKRKKGVEMNKIDTETKVKMLIALSVSIDEDLLNELRKNAHVEIDGNNRITKYIANNGRLELSGDHSPSSEIRSREDSIPKTPGSVKRLAPEVPNSSKRAKTREVKVEDFAPDPDDSYRINAPNPWIQQLRQLKSDLEGDSEFRNPEIQLLREPKLEEVPGAHILRETPIKTELED